MTKIYITILIILYPLISFGSDTIENQRKFKNIDSITQWAKSSAWGGYSIKEFKYNNLKILVVFRSFTSGVLSSDASIYIQNDKNMKWQRSFYKDTIHFDVITVSQDKNQLIFKSEKDNKIIFSLSLDYLAEELLIK